MPTAPIPPITEDQKAKLPKWVVSLILRHEEYKESIEESNKPSDVNIVDARGTRRPIPTNSFIEFDLDGNRLVVGKDPHGRGLRVRANDSLIMVIPDCANTAFVAPYEFPTNI